MQQDCTTVRPSVRINLSKLVVMQWHFILARYLLIVIGMNAIATTTETSGRETMKTFKSDVELASEIQSPREAFDAIRGTRFTGNKIEGFSVEYSGISDVIMNVVSKTSTGFQADIAKKAFLGCRISIKQAWCVAFEFSKIEHGMPAMTKLYGAI